MNKPVIGLNVDIKVNDPEEYSIDQTYSKAVVAAGGVPFLLPPVPESDFAQMIGMLDAVVLVGGDDYDPKFYGEPAAPETKIGAVERQHFDLALGKYIVEETALPLLGVCAGCQLLNIVRGGTLVQDVPSHVPDSSVKHSIGHGKFGSHPVTIEPGTRLQEIYPALAIDAPTAHHQSVGRLGHGLRVAARAEDGIIEAVELPGERFVVGVQWHPERDIVEHLCLFAEFVSQARTFRARRGITGAFGQATKSMQLARS